MQATPLAIPDVLLIEPKVFGDARGFFYESFNQRAFNEATGTNLQFVQDNHSRSSQGVLRGLHYHFNQVAYWYLAAGRIRVGLADLRRSLPTFRATRTIDLDAADSRGLYIPCGVAHGFLALTEVTLFYTVDNYYDGGDEFGLAWDDPDVAVAWQPTAAPVVSGRDAANPRFAAIPYCAFA